MGKQRVEIIVTDKLTLVDRLSTSFSDIGIYDAYKDLNLALKDKGYNIPASISSLWRKDEGFLGVEELATVMMRQLRRFYSFS